MHLGHCSAPTTRLPPTRPSVPVGSVVSGVVVSALHAAATKASTAASARNLPRNVCLLIPVLLLAATSEAYPGPEPPGKRPTWLYEEPGGAALPGSARPDPPHPRQ